MTLAFLTYIICRRADTVSFVCRAQPMSRLTAELGKATGLRLSVSGECANDVLLVSAKDVSVEKLLSEIAKVDAGEWRKDGEGLTFTANPNARRAEARLELARNARAIKGEIYRRKAALLENQGAGRGNEDGSVTPDLQAFSSADRKKVGFVLSGAATESAVLSLLEGLSPESLVLRRGQRVVCSTSPNRIQMSLGLPAQRVVENLVGTRNSVSEILQSAFAERKRRQPKYETLAPTDDPIVPPIVGRFKADLSVAAGDDPGGLEAQLTLFSPQGGVLFRSRNFSLRPTRKARPLPPSAASKEKVPVSATAKAFRKAYASRGALVEIPSILAAHLLDLERSDPLSLFTSDALLCLAQSTEKPLIALIPDDAFGDRASEEETITLGDVLQSLADGETMTMEAEDWTEIKPADPAFSRKARCDRSVLGSFMRSCLGKPIPTLSEFARFTKSTDYANNPIVSSYVASFVSGYGNGGLDTEGNWNLYRVYSGFSVDQRARLVAGEKLPLRMLADAQIANLELYAYGSLPHLTYGVGPIPVSGRFPSARPLRTDPVQNVQRGTLPPPRGFETEPTELLPNGIQPSGYIELKAFDEPFVSPVGSGDSVLKVPKVVGVAQMAAQLARAGHPGSNSDDAFRSGRFKLGQRQLYVLTIHGSDTAFVSGRLYDFQLRPNSPELSMDALPSEWLAEMNRRVAALKGDFSPAHVDRPL